MTRLQTITLGIAGVTALVIGAFILTSPHAFYAGYGITLGSDPNLPSEIRAPGAGLAGFGCIMLAGTPCTGLRDAATVAAVTVFLAFPAGRLLGIVFDGMPSVGILAALMLEFAIAALCLIAFRPGSGHAATGMTTR